MPELIARGTASDNRWRRRIPEGHEIVVGRTVAGWAVPWDTKISRRHFAMRLTGRSLHVSTIKDSANPVFYNGRKTSTFDLAPGEHFVIGDTTFRLSDDRAFVTLDVPDPVRQRTFTHEFLANVQYRDADRRIAVLNRLPRVISGAGTEQDLMIHLVNILIDGIRSASTIGVVRMNENVSSSGAAIEVLHWDRRQNAAGDFQPSESLIRQAISEFKSVLHVWNQNVDKTEPAAEIEQSVDDSTIVPRRSGQNYTIDYENDWAYVCPLPGEVCRSWGVYVAGRNRSGSGSDPLSHPRDLQGDIKFTELISVTLANVLDLKNMEQRQSSLRPFFAPVVMQAMADRDPGEVLTPRECDVSVLFCDLRGFTATSEEMADDLLGLLARVSETLGIMTRSVMNHGGVIGDFHGDAAMGFWGWPIDDPAAILRACNAALDIQSELKRIAADANSPLRDFQMGTGIATGPAVAGKIGTSDQVKVTAFGPVVNLASRLESMSRWFASMILTDGTTARGLDGSSLVSARRLGRVLPFGLARETEVFQIYFESDSPGKEHLDKFESALRNFESGEWQTAAARFTPLAENDSGAAFLLNRMIEAGGQAPDGFDGMIRMAAK